jgi:hypothetical protein
MYTNIFPVMLIVEYLNLHLPTFYVGIKINCCKELHVNFNTQEKTEANGLSYRFSRVSGSLGVLGLNCLAVILQELCS